MSLWSALGICVVLGLVAAAAICGLVVLFGALPDCQTLFHNITGHQTINGHVVRCFDGNVVGVVR